MNIGEMKNKAELRSFMKHKREAMGEAHRETLSIRATQRLMDLPELAHCRIVMSYMPIRNEVDTIRFNKAILAANKQLCLPRVRDEKDMDAFFITDFKLELAQGHFNIQEPLYALEPVNPASINIIILPGLAFDTRGNRLGFGKGYYDRFLQRADEKCLKIGLAYGFQVVEGIEAEPWDRKLDLVVTEDRVYRFHSP